MLPATQCTAKKVSTAWENSEAARRGQLGRRTEAFIRRTSHTREGEKKKKKIYSRNVSGHVVISRPASSFPEMAACFSGGCDCIGRQAIAKDVIFSVVHAANSPTQIPEAKPQAFLFPAQTDIPHTAADGITTQITPIRLRFQFTSK